MCITSDELDDNGASINFWSTTGANSIKELMVVG